MTAPIPLPTGSGDVTLSRSDLAAVVAELNSYRSPGSPEAVLRLLGDLRTAIEALSPSWDYFQVSAIDSYLRAISDPLDKLQRQLYPWRSDAERAAAEAEEEEAE